MKMKWNFITIVFVFMFSGTTTLRINYVNIPETFQNGTKDAVVLDCDYQITNTTGLVIKWFFNDRKNLIYQWIYGKSPVALGMLRNKVDLSYVASEVAHKRHRAIRITSVDFQLTGNYTCVVSTHYSEDQKTRPMTIFVPERRFKMVLDRINGRNSLILNIICEVEGVFPYPEISISAGLRRLNASTIVDPNATTGLYNIISHVLVNTETLPDTAKIRCELYIPQADYYSSKEEVFYKNPPAEPPKKLIDKDAGEIRRPSKILVGLCFIFVLFKLVR